MPNSPTAFDGVIKQAYEAGIPFITLDAHVDSPYAINIDTNYFLTGELVASGTARLIGGKGSVVIVDGIDGSPSSAALHSGYQAVLAECPDISVAGSVEGDWSEANAKSVMLQYLATHPEPVSAVIGGGGETTGIMQALQQTGRSLVPIGDANPDEGSLVAARAQLPGEYVASTDPPAQSMDAALRVAIGRSFQLVDAVPVGPLDEPVDVVVIAPELRTAEARPKADGVARLLVTAARALPAPRPATPPRSAAPADAPYSAPERTDR